MAKTASPNSDTAGFILDATERLRSNGGVAAVNIKAVAELAGVGVGTVYHYFASREALLKASEQRGWMREINTLLLRMGTPDTNGFADYLAKLIGGAIESAVRRFDALGFPIEIDEMRDMMFDFYEQVGTIMFQLAQSLKLPLRVTSQKQVVLAVEAVAMLAWVAALRHRDMLATGELQREVAQLAIRYLIDPSQLAG